jgi:nicastrin
VTDASDSWTAANGWPQDPVWAESNWPLGVPLLRLYQRESRSSEVAVLVSGLVLSAAVAVAAYVSKHAFEKHLKSQ